MTEKKINKASQSALNYGEKNKQSKPTSSYLVEHARILFFSAGFFALLSVAAFGPTVLGVLADLSISQQQAIQTKNAAISRAIANRDYNTWQSLITDEQLKTQVNESNFNTFAEAYALLEKGKIDEANILMKMISLKQQYADSALRTTAISQAIANNDYNTWRQLVGEDYARDLVTDRNFNAYAGVIKKIEAGQVNEGGGFMSAIGLKQTVDYSSSH